MCASLQVCGEGNTGGKSWAVEVVVEHAKAVVPFVVNFTKIADGGVDLALVLSFVVMRLGLCHDEDNEDTDGNLGEVIEMALMVFDDLPGRMDGKGRHSLGGYANTGQEDIY